MAKGFRDLAANPESRALDHAEWLGLLVEQEATLRQQKRFAARTRTAKLRQMATVLLGGLAAIASADFFGRACVRNTQRGYNRCRRLLSSVVVLANSGISWSNYEDCTYKTSPQDSPRELCEAMMAVRTIAP